MKPDKTELETVYREGFNQREIAEFYMVDRSTICDWLLKYGIPLRSQSDTMLLLYERHPEYRESCSLGSVVGWQKHPEAREAVRSRMSHIHHSRQVRKRMSASHKIYAATVEGKQQILEALRKASLKHQLKLQDPQGRAEWLSKTIKSFRRRPTQPEEKLINIINQYHLPYKYTGDGSFIVAGLNPDFININGAKIVIEIFGDYWHGAGIARQLSTEKGRRARLAELGWDLIVLWQSEIDKLTDDEIVNRITIAESKQKEEVLCHKSHF